MDARRNTPEGDRLDVLVTLVEAYVEKHWRVNPPDPIEAIKLRMQGVRPAGHRAPSSASRRFRLVMRQLPTMESPLELARQSRDRPERRGNRWVVAYSSA